MAALSATSGRRVLLIIGGGIAAYKALELIRLLRKAEIGVAAVLTEAGARFVTPLSVQALTGERIYTDLWSLTDESEMGHIELSRSADLLVVAPATADLLARMAVGIADDLASTVLLATDKPVLVAPAMNVRMWQHAATVDNLARLRARSVAVVGPDEGPMACGEFGSGRLAEPPAIFDSIVARLGIGRALAGKRALVTAGPTYEPIDPVRFLGNRSSGRQGYAIASALAALGASVTLVSGPVALEAPAGVAMVRVETAEDMLNACLAALPADVAVLAAAVADWRASRKAHEKIKKLPGAGPPSLTLAETPDILATLSHLPRGRPRLVIGFAAETSNLLDHAREKRRRKGCDWIVANDVSPETGIMGGGENHVVVIDEAGEEAWPMMAKSAVAARLAGRIALEIA